MCNPTSKCTETVTASSLPDPSEWINRPLYITAGKGMQASSSDGTKADATSSLPLGEKIAFETDLFVGIFYLRLRDLTAPYANDAAQMSSHTAYFDGKKRFYQMVVQGKFKADDLTFADLCIGDVYDKPFVGVPKGRAMKLYEKFMETLSPGLIMDMTGDNPTVLAPAGSAQTLRADAEGDEPTDFDALVDHLELIGDFGTKRKKKLSNPKTARLYDVDPAYVYTFECYDHSMDFLNYSQVVFLGKKIDLLPSLNGQTMSLGMYKRDSTCIYKFPMWHESLVAAAAEEKNTEK
mmetsp:Transcript_29968/g.72389  ORF Transcript_29968/g.72389 Transcript_29968/m.72389 type:complete len:293 (+) Transcript_29968:112-990(+)